MIERGELITDKCNRRTRWLIPPATLTNALADLSQQRCSRRNSGNLSRAFLPGGPQRLPWLCSRVRYIQPDLLRSGNADSNAITSTYNTRRAHQTREMSQTLGRFSHHVLIKASMIPHAPKTRSCKPMLFAKHETFRKWGKGVKDPR